MSTDQTRATETARGRRQKLTIASALFPHIHASQAKAFEKFRRDFEAEFGKTDLRLRYTSTWPAKQQEWLLHEDPKAYFDGLPPFAQAYLRDLMKTMAGNGKLDDMPTEFIALFTRGQMQITRSDEDRAR